MKIFNEDFSRLVGAPHLQEKIKKIFFGEKIFAARLEVAIERENDLLQKINFCSSECIVLQS